MKKFAFLKLFPAGWGSGNMVLAETHADNLAAAVLYFKTKYPEYSLNDNGFSKVRENTYCIAEYFC